MQDDDGKKKFKAPEDDLLDAILGKNGGDIVGGSGTNWAHPWEGASANQVRADSPSLIMKKDDPDKSLLDSIINGKGHGQPKNMYRYPWEGASANQGRADSPSFIMKKDDPT